MRYFHIAMLCLFFMQFLFPNNTFANSEITSFDVYYLEEDPYLPFAEIMPEPVGGMEAIYKKIKFPEFAKRAQKEGKVYLMIYISETGNVDDVKIIKGIGYGCDDEAVDAIKSAKFTPGKNGGVSVKVKMSLSINFKLSKSQ